MYIILAHLLIVARLKCFVFFLYLLYNTYSYLMITAEMKFLLCFMTTYSFEKYRLYLTHEPPKIMFDRN